MPDTTVSSYSTMSTNFIYSVGVLGWDRTSVSLRLTALLVNPI